MQGGGFEPPKAEPAGLQPAPFGHSGTPAGRAIVAAARRTAYDRGMERFDVLVVGAGPAGSATAIHLQRAGMRVLLVDKARFPRDKPCGGGLTGRALRHLPCAVDPVVEHVVDRMVVRVRYRAKVARKSAEPLIEMTQRRRLDLHLAEQAAAAGAEFRDGVAVSDVELGDAGVTARVGSHLVGARFLVGADGANGVVARSAGLGEGIVRGVALEGNVAWSALERDPVRRNGLGRARRRSRRLRLGVPEGRSCEPRSGGLADGRASPARASRPPRACSRDRSVRGHRRTRASSADARARLACGSRPSAPRRRRGRARRSAVGRRHVRGVRLRTARLRRHRRRASGAVRARARRQRSIDMPRRRGRESARPTAIHAPAWRRFEHPESSVQSRRCFAETSRIRARLAGSRGRRCARCRAWRATQHPRHDLKSASGSCRCTSCPWISAPCSGTPSRRAPATST